MLLEITLEMHVENCLSGEEDSRCTQWLPIGEGVVCLHSSVSVHCEKNHCPSPEIVLPGAPNLSQGLIV